jgi:hypothetical protein
MPLQWTPYTHTKDAMDNGLVQIWYYGYCFVDLYNGERGHQSLGYQTPDGVYATGQGGGAKIIDKFGRLAEPVSAPPPEDEAAPEGNEQQVFCWT